ncbi:hypothetical protein B0H63DRAFT_471440 [Podospora didyma]|uniref:MI domain-containing protein n=1 Tax=Podospora didyma TaxID=330526 RepID=A0AAE0NNE5_9PEZI|nr:hypothetical protein B0H63DRAFT_471440 [Podospora didyma]
MPPQGAKMQGPQLPLHLLKELGASDSQSRQKLDKHWPQQNRKEQRKTNRQQRKVERVSASRIHHAERVIPSRNAKAKTPRTTAASRTSKTSVKAAVPTRRERKLFSKKRAPELDDEIIENPFSDDEVSSGDFDDDFYDSDSEEEEQPPPQPHPLSRKAALPKQPDSSKQVESPGQAAVPRHVKEKLAEDDAEIADLERKLGLKGRKTLPKSFQDDGLGELLGELDEGHADEEVVERKKRKAEADDWLAEKRRKATEQNAKQERPAPDSEESDNGFGGFDSDDMDEDDMPDLGSEGDKLDDDDSQDEGISGNSGNGSENKAPRVRENPYVAPTTGQKVAKYVPPSLRQETGSDAELTGRIRRQTQGLVNRITESNLLSILGDIEKLYRDYPRQHVSSTLVDLLLIQVCDPTSLPDTLIILTAGFATAAYRVIGMDFGAQLIQDVVDRFSNYYNEAALAAIERPDVSKQTSNLITFLSKLYGFELIGPNLLFDYIRLLLGDLTELNAELLLRVIRSCGPSLRHDDPMALKDIISLIRPAVTKIGEQNLSVRTKFMIETINDLKNNKMKTGIGASAVVSEHTTRMKKLLGSLSSRKLKSTEPLRMGLKDIQQSDKKGKWWLVGATWAGPAAKEKTSDMKAADEHESDDDDDSILLSDVDGGPDLGELAREQQMNTDVRRSIFVAILSATDYEDAYLRIHKLRLNKERQREIPNVIMQCSGAEKQYNPYYTLVAMKLCSDRKVRWSFQDSLWRLFRRLGESVFGDEAEDEDEDEAIDTRRLVNIAKMFGSLVATGGLGISIIKCLNLPYLQPKTRAFVEILLIAALLKCQTSENPEDAISAIFRTAESVPDLARGLQWFLKKVVRKSDLAGGKANAKQLKEASKTAEAILEIALSAAQGDLEA